MRLIRAICFAILLAISSRVCDAVSRQFPASGALRFSIHDDINLPWYSWPRTLVSYPVDFSASAISPDQLQLFDAAGKPQAFQLSSLRMDAGKINSATVNFFTDLPPGQTRSFELRKVDHAAGVPGPAIHEESHDGVVEVDAGDYQVRLPQSGAIAAGQTVPAPIIAIKRGQTWIGDNRLMSPNRRVLSIDSQRLETGELFAVYRITYVFDGGASYAATLKIVQGYPFIEFDDETTGLAASDNARLEMAWTNFSPDMRFPAHGFDAALPHWLRMDEPVITPDIEEDPKWQPASLIEYPTKDMAFRLCAFSGNGVRDATPAVSFWDDHAGGMELSLFTLDTLKWQDHTYGIWQPGTALCVHFRFDPQTHTLHFTWPLVTGTRSTGIALADAKASQANADARVQQYLAVSKTFGGSGGVTKIADIRLRDAQVLRSWYGPLSLDRVKDWILTYPDAARQAPAIFKDGDVKSPADVDARFARSTLSLYPLGLNLVAMNIRHRELYDTLIPAYNRFHTQLSPAVRARTTAMMLLAAYLNTGDDMSPVRICLSGTPNMSSDSFCVPAEISLLFPDHPMVGSWLGQFEKTLALMGCFYTRPNVPSWDSLGGRWTESLSTYNWAYLRPTQIAGYCALSADHRNRFANPWMALRGRWMVDELTAPIHNPDPYALLDTGSMPADADVGMDRQYPSHGAHGSGTTVPVYPAVSILAQALHQYDPMTSEHLFWAAAQERAKITGEFSPDLPWNALQRAQIPANDGTPPHLASSKYTGHGLIFRAGVGTPGELSIHLDQIDPGPNYRWGDNGEGSCGVLYFYADGKIWTGYGHESTGDHYNEETLGETNFGFMKDGHYRCIGANVLDSPMYDLGVAQFGQITSRHGDGAYSWPQYDSRSILLVGTDYFLLLDKTPAQPIPAAGRFSWFQTGDLRFPKIIFLKPLAAIPDHWTEVQGKSFRGFLRDTEGTSLALVTAKKDSVEMEDMQSEPVAFPKIAQIRQYSWAKNAKPTDGVWHVHAPASHDIVFRNDDPIHYADADGIQFDGTAGILRHRDDGSTQLAIFQGSRIATGAITLTLPETDQVGISATYAAAGEISGEFYAPHGPSKLTISFHQTRPVSIIYIDGQKQALINDANGISFSLPAGHHHWQLTADLPTPMAPQIDHTGNFAGGAAVYFSTVPGANAYRVEISHDGGSTWLPTAEAPMSPFRVTGLTNNTKVHVRVIAQNAHHQSDPSDAYPIYVSDAPPPPPDGLWLDLSPNRVSAAWGQVLGVTEYRLYRRHRGEGEKNWQFIYFGPDHAFVDAQALGVLPPDELPGGTHDSALPIYEYCVASANENGEGTKSDLADTDPASWRNWWPPGVAKQFKRQAAYWLPPYVPASDIPEASYP